VLLLLGRDSSKEGSASYSTFMKLLLCWVMLSIALCAEKCSGNVESARAVCDRVVDRIVEHVQLIGDVNLSLKCSDDKLPLLGFQLAAHSLSGMAIWKNPPSMQPVDDERDIRSDDWRCYGGGNRRGQQSKEKPPAHLAAASSVIVFRTQFPFAVRTDQHAFIVADQHGSRNHPPRSHPSESRRQANGGSPITQGATV
jgi:hypothetical protein